MTHFERYRLVSRRPVLRLELRQALRAALFTGVAAALWLLVWFGADGRRDLLAVASLCVLVGAGAMLRRERWTIGRRGVRLDRAPWRRPVERPREQFERVTLRSEPANGEPRRLPWQVALEDGDGGGLFVFSFTAELPARVVGLLVVEALELERVDDRQAGEVDPEVDAAVRAAMARL